MSFSIESSLPAPTPVYGLRRKVARNGGRSGRKSAWPPRCGEEEFLNEAEEHGLWEVRCERDRIAGLDEVLAYLETQAMALDGLEGALNEAPSDEGWAALHRRFREIAVETFNGVRLLGGDSEVRLLGEQCPEAFDVLEGGRFYLLGSQAGEAPAGEVTATELLRADIGRLRKENHALQARVRQLRAEAEVCEDMDVTGAQDTLVNARGQVARDSGGALIAQAHAMNGAVLRLLD